MLFPLPYSAFAECLVFDEIVLFLGVRDVFAAPHADYATDQQSFAGMDHF